MYKTLLPCCLLLGALAPHVHADHLFKRPLPPCEPGFRWEEVTEYKEVECYVCKIVPDVIKHKKIIYTTKDDPFCIHHSGKKGCICAHGCDEGCPTCKGPYCRKQLVKKEVVCEEVTTKCVTEKTTKLVPCTVLRKVPCGPAGCPTPVSVTPITDAPVSVTPVPLDPAAPSTVAPNSAVPNTVAPAPLAPTVVTPVLVVPASAHRAPLGRPTAEPVFPAPVAPVK